MVISGCGNEGNIDGKTRVNAGADEYVGQNLDTVVNDFKMLGFNKIETIPIADLPSKGDTIDGTVESVSINGATFSKDESFLLESDISIVFHTINKLSIPLSETEVNSESLKTIEENFVNAGFVDVATSEIIDLDPDLYEEDQLTAIIVEGNEITLDGSTSYPYDSTIEIVRHYTYTKYSLNLQIDFPGNWFFDKYDVVVSVDGESITTLPHGQGWNGEIRYKSGYHTMVFSNKDNAEVKGEIPFELSEDTDAEFSIACYSNAVSPQVVYYQPRLQDSMVRMSYGERRFLYKDYNDVINELRTLGYTNLKTSIYYDIVFGFTSSGETAGVSIAGRRDYGNGDVFNKDDEVIIYYHMPQADDPTVIAQREAEAQRQREEEERQRAEAEAEAERRANMWCQDPIYDNFAKNLNNRLPDNPLTKQNVHDQYDRVTIHFDGYEVFYYEFTVDTGGPNDGRPGKWLTLDGAYSGSSRKLSDQDKEIIKIVFGLSDEDLSEMVNAFQNGKGSVTINGREYNFYRNTGSWSTWGIEYKVIL